MKVSTCSTCKTEFASSRACKWCPDCTLDRRRQATREFMRKQRLERPDHVSVIKKCSRYGIDADVYMQMLSEQNYLCACCPVSITARTAYVDHDHACCSGPNLRACSRCVRGLLCIRCNSALGMALDNPETLRRLADYLESRRLKAVS